MGGMGLSGQGEINPPSVAAVVRQWFRCLPLAVAGAGILSLLLYRSSTEAFLAGLAGWSALACGWGAVKLVLQGLYEPTLTISDDGLTVRRWGSDAVRLERAEVPTSAD
jgi:hypothetical protein